MRDFLDPYGFKMPEIPGTSAAYVFSAQYQAVYDSFVVKPAADIAQQQDIMVRALVADGVWATKDILYIIANNTRENAVINWINPGTYDAIEVNAPTFTAYRGFAGNGVNQYLRTQFNPRVANAAGANYAQDDVHTSIYSRTDSDVAVYDFGVRDTDAPTSQNRTALRFGDNRLYCRLNGNISDNAINGDSTGFYVTNRTAANSIVVYRNGAILINAATASTAIPDDEIYICCYNLNGAAASFSARQYAQFSLGSSLDEAGNSEVTNYQSALETYLDYVGAGVIP